MKQPCLPKLLPLPARFMTSCSTNGTGMSCTRKYLSVRLVLWVPLLWQKGDLGMIDKGAIHGGVVASILAGAARMRAMQTGMVFHYAFAMVIGVFGFLTYLLLKS